MKCIKCGEEIPDDSPFCNKCGAKQILGNISESTNIYKTQPPTQENPSKIKSLPLLKRPKILKIFIIALSAILVIGIGVSIFYITNKPKFDYEKAMSYYNDGDYAQASNILKTIPNYQGVTNIKKNISNELFAKECIKKYEKALKNPESLQVRGIQIVENADMKQYGTATFLMLDSSAQNGFGGDNENLALFYRDKTEGAVFVGACDNLDATQQNQSDSQNYAAYLIASQYWNTDKSQKLDVDRIKKSLKH